MQNRLVNEEVTITHARYFLHEVDRVELHVIVGLFNGLAGSSPTARLCK